MAEHRQPYVEHVAVRVKDLEWYVDFFRQALGMEITESQGESQNPSQVWIGGIQLTRDSDYQPPDQGKERCWHIGINVADQKAALDKVYAYVGISRFEDKENWFILPDGLVIELVSK